MFMEIITSVNLMAGATVLNDNESIAAKNKTGEHRDTVKVAAKCGGDLRIENICDPVCERIFSDISDKKKSIEKAKHIFNEIIECDSVCTCICEAICDKFM